MELLTVGGISILLVSTAVGVGIGYLVRKSIAEAKISSAEKPLSKFEKADRRKQKH